MSDLTLSSVVSGYGRKTVVFDATLSAPAGQVTVLLGHNGAGKTTILKTILGLIPAQSGSVTFEGEDISRSTPRANLQRGIAYMPSERFVYDDLSVDDNLIAASLAVPKRQRKYTVTDVHDLLSMLKDRGTQLAGTLSGGQKRILSTGMLLMVNPKMMLLDEPSLGLAPAVVEQLFDFYRSLATDTGIGLLLVEQNVGEALRIGDEVFALRSGRIFLRESAERLSQRTEFWDLF
jgi:branched-chain amino acid transport system ATP-binding protein